MTEFLISSEVFFHVETLKEKLYILMRSHNQSRGVGVEKSVYLGAFPFHFSWLISKLKAISLYGCLLASGTILIRDSSSCLVYNFQGKCLWCEQVPALNLKIWTHISPLCSATTVESWTNLLVSFIHTQIFQVPSNSQRTEQCRPSHPVCGFWLSPSTLWSRCVSVQVSGWVG